MAEIKEIIHKNDQLLKILFQKTGSGYNWEIHITGNELFEIMPKLREANNKLKGEYSGRA